MIIITFRSSFQLSLFLIYVRHLVWTNIAEWRFWLLLLTWSIVLKLIVLSCENFVSIASLDFLVFPNVICILFGMSWSNLFNLITLNQNLVIVLSVNLINLLILLFWLNVQSLLDSLQSSILRLHQFILSLNHFGHNVHRVTQVEHFLLNYFS